MIRRAAICVALTTLLLATFFTPVARAVGPDRTVSGRVLIESPTSDVPRCAWILKRQQGIAGWVIRLSPSEGDGRHRFILRSQGPLRGADAEALGDVDVEFFGTLGSCVSGSNSLGDGYEGFQSDRNAVSKQGTIPAGARYAVLGRWRVEFFVGYWVSAGINAAAKSTFTFSIWHCNSYRFYGCE